jgi:hypothetical protein
MKIVHITIIVDEQKTSLWILFSRKSQERNQDTKKVGASTYL